MSTKCETCVYYSYDEEYDDYICEMDLDEDEMVRFLSARADACPYWRPGDDYRSTPFRLHRDFTSPSTSIPWSTVLSHRAR